MRDKSVPTPDWPTSSAWPADVGKSLSSPHLYPPNGVPPHKPEDRRSRRRFAGPTVYCVSIVSAAARRQTPHGLRTTFAAVAAAATTTTATVVIMINYNNNNNTSNSSLTTIVIVYDRVLPVSYLR